jgi:hypothetical protein
MKINYYVFFIFTLFQTAVFAQTAPVKQVGLVTGLTYEAIKSDAYSPRILSGIKPPLSIAFQILKNKSRHTFELGILSIQPKEAANTSVEDINGHLSYEWLKRVYEWKNIQFYGGVSGSITGSHRQNITRKLPNNNEAFEESTTLNAAILAEYIQSGNRLTAQLNYSVFGYQFGTLYDYAFMGKRILTPFNLLQINGLIRLNAPISKHFNFITGYRFYLYRSGTPQYLGILKHQIEVGTAFVF